MSTSSSGDDNSAKTPLLKSTNTKGGMDQQTSLSPGQMPRSLDEHHGEGEAPRTTTVGETAPQNVSAGASRRPVSESSDVAEEETLKYGAKHVMMLFVPVIICMALVVITMTTTTVYQHQPGFQLPYTPFAEKKSQSGLTNVWHGIMNALIVLGVVVVMTVVLVVLYKYRCYKILFGWLYLATGMLLFFFSYLYLVDILTYFNIPLDFFTGGFILWNFGVTGMIAVHWKAPLVLQQAYLIMTSALTALLFIRFLPEWTGWMVLGIIALWDLVAVLCPMGPLRILVNIATEREETLFPALIYSSTVIYTIGMSDTEKEAKRKQGGDSTNKSPPPGEPEASTSALGAAGDGASIGSTESERARKAQRALNSRTRVESQDVDEEEEEERGVKLGLGDFIFYSLLVGKASTVGDWNTTLACSVAILMGLCFTLLLLAIYKKALPALPISIAFGLIFFFGTTYFIKPFMEVLQTNQVFI